MIGWISDLSQDVRQGLRLLGKAPVFSATCLATLAITLGASSAMFNVVDHVLLQELPYPHADRLVDVSLELPARDGEAAVERRLDLRQLERLQEGAPGFEGWAAYQVGRATLTGSDVPRRLATSRVSPRLFALLGVDAELGRTFVPADGRVGAERRAVVSDRLWRDRFASDRQRLGELLLLDGTPYSVVGILPPGFGFPDPGVDVWLPLEEARPGSDTDRGVTTEYFPVVARLADGVTVEGARSGVQAVLDRQDGRTAGRVSLIPLREKITAGVRSALWALYGAVLLVLLIASVNLANLLMARNLGRQREMALRAALGGGRGRLIRQLLTESLVLSVLGGGLGLFVALWIHRMLPSLLPADLPRLDSLDLDPRFFLFSFALAIATGALFGAWPAVRGASQRVVRPVQSGTTEAPTERGSRRLLVVVEVALAVVVMVGGGLLLRSFERLTSIDSGFEPNNVLVATLDLGNRYPSQGARTELFDRLVDRLQAHPSIESVGVVSFAPLTTGFSMISLQVVGKPPGRTLAVPQKTSPGYLAAVGLRLRAGRWITPEDHAARAPVAVVNKTFADRYLDDQGAVGTQLQLGAEVLRIVGVVDDVRLLGPTSEPRPEVFTSFHRDAPTTLTLAVRTLGDPVELMPFLRSAVAQLDADLPLEHAGSLAAGLASSTARPRFYAILLGLFALLGVILAAIGIYGVLAELVLRQKRSIGVRRALGARNGHVLRLVLSEGLVLLLAGLVLGVLVALGAAKLLSGLLYDVSPSDPATYSAAVLGVLLVGLTACLLPVWRAMQVDPLDALRHV